MSFLNPVSEPVLRFSSTDAGAPQINYNSRVAGDVKTVLKACLVTGYGDKASAGWSIVNEVDHVCEFVSPSLAMSNFKLQVDDSATTKTLFNYIKNTDPAALITSNDKSHTYVESGASDGWHLFVTDSTLIFVEIINSKKINKPIGRLTYFGQVKSALSAAAPDSVIMWASGWRSSRQSPHELFFVNYYSYRPLFLGDNALYAFMVANQSIVYNESSKTENKSVIDFWSDVYLTDTKFVMAQHPAISFGVLRDDTKRFNVSDGAIGDRPVFMFYMGAAESSEYNILKTGINVSIYLDYWEY